MLTSFRLEKDSSNDAEMFEDSSGEGSDATCGLKDNGVSSLSTSTNKAENIGKDVTENSKSLVPLNQSSNVFDEETLMKMTDEEQQFFDNYRKGKISLIFLNFHCLSVILYLFAANHAQLSSLKCTTCSCQLFLVNRENIRIHPVLGVLVCKVSFI